VLDSPAIAPTSWSEKNHGEDSDFENHAETFAPFHFVAMPIFLLFFWSAYRVMRVYSFESRMALLLSVAFILLAFSARIFPLPVQERLIRLEMRLRLQQILPVELRPRIREFELGQLIALRSASDAESPNVAKRVRDEKLMDRNSIKKMVQDWQPDLLRA
jgi:Family of unknown function (DUF6526)